MTTQTTPDSTGQVIQAPTTDNTVQVTDPQGNVVAQSPIDGDGVDLGQVGRNFQESKRVQRLAEKEANRYQNLVNEDGSVDFDSISAMYRGNAISKKALEIFCASKGLDKEDVVQRIQNPYEAMQKRLEALEKSNGGGGDSFESMLATELQSRGISNKDFAQYKDEFEAELEDLSGLEDGKAIKKALDLSLIKGKSKVKVPSNDPTPAGVESGNKTLSKDDYLNFMNKRSKEVGNMKATEEFEKYKADQIAKGLPLFEGDKVPGKE